GGKQVPAKRRRQAQHGEARRGHSLGGKLRTNEFGDNIDGIPAGLNLPQPMWTVKAAHGE
ncbi:hypothetical protein, partial [Escherichia coli]|uniref:hypothetical protein n=1 Tax=Escherichia coli TaxID=562 RepID=UPI0028DF1438